MASTSARQAHTLVAPSTWIRNGITTTLILGATAVGHRLVPSAEAQERADLLRWYVSGPQDQSASASGGPQYLSGLRQVQELLIQIGEAPRDGNYIEAALEGTGASITDLVSAQWVRKEGDVYSLGFPLITVDDAEQLLQVSLRFGRSLADAYLEQRAAIGEAIRAYEPSHVDRRAVAYILVGCFSLDWEGLALTRELGYRAVRAEPPPIVRWAIVREAWKPKEVYWGSHNNYLPSGTVLTSFGDFHSLPRTAFPDLAGRVRRGISSADVPDELRPALQPIADRITVSFQERIGAVMLALRNGDNTAGEVAATIGTEPDEVEAYLVLLDSLEYVAEESGSYTPAIPVFTDSDRAMVHKVRRLSREIMVSWLDANYDRYKEALMQVTPIGHALTFEESFWNTWHWLFGVTNRILVQEGMFADPYADDRKFHGFVPAVWHFSLMEDIPLEHIYQ